MQRITVQDNEHDELIENEDVVATPPKKILRKTKTYEYDAGRDLLDQKMNITFRQGAQLSPAVRQQIRAAVSTATPGFKIVEMNTTEFVKSMRQQLNTELARHEQEEEEDYDSDEELEERDEPEHSSAYTQCSIEGHVTPVIIDTGAGGCMISEYLLKKIGWTVEATTRQTMVVADRHVSRPLRHVFELS